MKAQNRDTICTLLDNVQHSLRTTNERLSLLAETGVHYGVFTFTEDKEKSSVVIPQFLAVFMSIADVPSYNNLDYDDVDHTLPIIALHGKIRFDLFNINNCLRDLAHEGVKYAIKTVSSPIPADTPEVVPTVRIEIYFAIDGTPEYE